MEHIMNKEKMLHFCKFDGAGNDFVLLDIREKDPHLTTEQIASICHRRFGVGADGLMTLGNAPEGYDFEMRYYNSDGRLGSMCGNGGRCIAMFAHLLGIGDGHLHFLGFDGPHDADVLDWNADALRGTVCLGMRDVSRGEIRQCLQGSFLDTGSPHYVQEVEDLEHFDVFNEGRRLRHDAEFPEGTNVDFIQSMPDGRLFVRTFERGVEDETWACGTGVTACAIVSGNGNIYTRGGEFRVTYKATETAYTDVRLTGPVSFDFDGNLYL